MNAWIYMSIAIVGEVIGTSALKASEGFTRMGWSVATVVAYATTFYFLSLALKSIPVGMAYAVWAGLGIVLIACIGWVLFGQKLDGWAILGIALILSGVLVMNLLSKSSAH